MVSKIRNSFLKNSKVILNSAPILETEFTTMRRKNLTFPSDILKGAGKQSLNGNPFPALEVADVDQRLSRLVFGVPRCTDARFPAGRTFGIFSTAYLLLRVLKVTVTNVVTYTVILCNLVHKKRYSPSYLLSLFGLFLGGVGRGSLLLSFLKIER